MGKTEKRRRGGNEFLLNSNKGEGGKKMKAEATKKECSESLWFHRIHRERIAASM